MGIRATIAKASLTLSRTLLSIATRALFLKIYQDSSANGIRHIVLYRVGNIGDTVVAMPAFHEVRRQFPHAKITLVTSAGNPELPGAPDVLEPFPHLVDHIISYLPQALKTPNGLRHLRDEIFAHGGPVDLLIDLPVTLQTLRRGLQELMLAKILKARYITGFELLLPPVFKSHYARKFPEKIPRTSDWLFDLVSWSKRSVSENPEFPGRFSPLDLSRYGLDTGRPLLILNAGAKLGIKRWPAASYADALMDHLKSHPETQVALLGNNEETALNDGILATVTATLPQARIVNLSGKLSLSDTWALLQQATMVLSNDTGTMHMAGLLNKPVLTPMSGQYPAPLWHPPGSRFTAPRHPTPCAPCFRNTCKYAEQTCLTGLLPATITAELEKLRTES